MVFLWIQAGLLFVAGFAMELATKTNSLPNADKLSYRSKFSSAGGRGGEADEHGEYSVVISRKADILTNTQSKKGHYKEITLTLTSFNETFILDLKLNKFLFASTYFEKVKTNAGQIYNEVNHITDHCYYTGLVRNQSQSTAAVSTCTGITGYFEIDFVSYHIEGNGDAFNGRLRVFRERGDVKKSFRCGTDQQLRGMSGNNSTLYFGQLSHRMKRSFLYPQDRDKVDRVIELYVANDKSQYLAQSSNINDVYRRTKEIVNIASLAYQPLGIYIVLVGVEVWTTSDQFAIPASNVSLALSNWYTYRKNSINPFIYNDNAALITNVPFYDGLVGKANYGTMCSNQFSGSIISDLSSLSAVTGTTLAHEIGHCFGLQHDDQIAECTCDDSDANNHCIMSSSTDPHRPSTTWSSCSKIQFAAAFSQGLDLCLYNIPQTIFQSSSSTCGNGIVEDGEECDCANAPSSECNSACCNNSTCQLTASATCAFGRCCDTSVGQIKSAGTECRPKSDDCDISESCNGVDARCPTDSYKPDGTDCANTESAYCYKGRCQSHRSQCELLWGPATQVSNDLCYTSFNIHGKHYGNCGVKWKDNGVNYISCASKDVKCGRLQCENVTGTLYSYKNYLSWAKTYIGSHSCNAVIFDFGAQTQDPGLAPSGAKCGDKQMCVNQKCTSIDDLPAMPSPAIISKPSSTTTHAIPSATTKNSKLTISQRAKTIDLVLVVAIGTLVLVMAVVLFLFCCYMFCPAGFVSCCKLFHIGRPKTTSLPLVSLTMSAFTRRAMITRQYRRLRTTVD